MDIRPGKPYKTMTAQEQKDYQWEKSLIGANPFLYAVYAAGLAPAYRHMVDSGDQFAIVSAERPDYEDILEKDKEKRKALIEQRNWERTQELRTHLKDIKQGYVPAGGVWNPEGGKPYYERPVFAPGMSKQKAIELGKKYKQDSVIWGSGGNFWYINTRNGHEDGPLLVKERFRHIPPGEPLGKDEGETSLREKDTQRFQFKKDFPLTLAVRVGKRLNVGPYRVAFFYCRFGGGTITSGLSPTGISVHNDLPGTVLTGDCNDGRMAMGFLDAYVPLYEVPEDASRAAAQALHDEISRVKPEDRQTLQDKWKKRKLP